MLDSASRILNLVEQNEDLQALYSRELLDVQFYYASELFNQAMSAFSNAPGFDPLRAIVVLRTIGDYHGRYPSFNNKLSDQFRYAAASLGDKLVPLIAETNLNYRDVFARLISTYTEELTAEMGKENSIMVIKDLLKFIGLAFISDDHTRIDYSQEEGPILNDAALHFFKTSAALCYPSAIQFIRIFERAAQKETKLSSLLQARNKDIAWIQEVTKGYTWSSKLPLDASSLPEYIHCIRERMDPNDFITFSSHIERELET